MGSRAALLPRRCSRGPTVLRSSVWIIAAGLAVSEQCSRSLACSCGTRTFEVRLTSTASLRRIFVIDAADFAALQHHRGTAVKGDHAWLLLGKRSDHMAEPAHRRIEAEDEGNGEPVLNHASTSLLEKWLSRLPQKHYIHCLNANRRAGFLRDRWLTRWRGKPFRQLSDGRCRAPPERGHLHRFQS